MKKKILLYGVLGFAVIILIAGLAFRMRYTKMADTIAGYEVEDMDLSMVMDGVYTGEAGDFLVYVKVEVAVDQGEIKRIEIVEQECGPGYEGEETVERIMDKQSPEVDVVTGATGSSMCIKAAVYRALKKGMR